MTTDERLDIWANLTVNENVKDIWRMMDSFVFLAMLSYITDRQFKETIEYILKLKNNNKHV
jgi:hypothetical protein